MHIIWITTQFPNAENKVNGIFIYRTVKELSKLYKITVVCLYPTPPPVFTMLKNLKNSKTIFKKWKKLYPSRPTPPEGLYNVDVIYLRYPRLWRGKLLFLEGLFAYIWGRESFKKLIKTDTFLHSNWIFPESKLAMIIAKKYNIPFIVTLRGGEVDVDKSLKYGTKNYTEAKKIINYARQVTSVSRELVIRFKEHKLIPIDKKTSITHNIYEFNKFFIKGKYEAREILNLPPNENVILCVASLTKRKNIHSLIEAFDSLNDKSQNRLIIIGAGIEENFLKEIVTAKKLDNVIFIEKVLPDKLVDFYNAADVFCLLSFQEGLPNVIIESLLCGTPVVGSAVDEIPYIIKENINGFLINPSSVDDIISKINTALKTKWNRIAIRESINFLSQENVINEYDSIYKNIL